MRGLPTAVTNLGRRYLTHAIARWTALLQQTTACVAQRAEHLLACLTSIYLSCLRLYPFLPIRTVFIRIVFSLLYCSYCIFSELLIVLDNIFYVHEVTTA